MTTPEPDRPPPPRRRDQLSSPKGAVRTRGWWAWLWPKTQLLLSVLLTLGVLAWLLWSEAFHAQRTLTTTDKKPDEPPVQLTAKGRIAIKPDTALEKKLQVVPVAFEEIKTPILQVTGTVVAQLRPGEGVAEDRWQFSAAEVLTAYADWRKAANDLVFVKSQLIKVRDLFDARMVAQTEVVERLKKTVAAGTDAVKDLRVEEAKLKETDLQGRKDVHEAENTVRVAERNLAALERQLFQNGVDPHLMARVADGTAIVVADVPEAKVGAIEPGRACQAQFYGFPGQMFDGKVGSLAPTLSKERRTLRVLFDLRDPQGRLRPGMFADVGLGTDPRKTVLIPADAVLHVGLFDYVLAQAEEPGLWRSVKVKVSEQIGDRVEVLDGLKGTERVIGHGAILLKPFVARSLSPNERSNR